MPLIVSPTTLAIIDGLVAFLFACEWLKFICTYGFIYKYMTVDLLAWIPGMVHLFMLLSSPAFTSTDENVSFKPVPEWLAAMCIFRIFKLERYLHSFRDMMNIFKDNW